MSLSQLWLADGTFGLLAVDCLVVPRTKTVLGTCNFAELAGPFDVSATEDGLFCAVEVDALLLLLLVTIEFIVTKQINLNISIYLYTVIIL